MYTHMYAFGLTPLPLTAYVLYGCPLRCRRRFNPITRPVTKSMGVVFTLWRSWKDSQGEVTSRGRTRVAHPLIILVLSGKCTPTSAPMGVCVRRGVKNLCRQGFLLENRVHFHVKCMPETPKNNRNNTSPIVIILHPFLLLPAKTTWNVPWVRNCQKCKLSSPWINIMWINVRNLLAY